MARRLRKKPASRTIGVPPSVRHYVNKRIINKSEEKLALIVPPTSVGTTWNESELTVIAQGSAQTNRVGDSFTVTKVGMYGVIAGGQSNLAADDNRNVVRIVVAEWDGRSATPLATNGANMSDLIQSDETAGAGLVRLLYDKYIVLNSPGRDSTGYMPVQKAIRWNKKLQKVIKYASATQTTANTRIIISMISDSLVVPSPGFIYGRFVLKYHN